MVATIKIYVDTGGTAGSPGTSTDTTSLGPPNIRLKTSDDPTIDLLNATPLPNAGTNYTFWKSCYAYCAVAPVTQVGNFRIYTGGADFGTGIVTSIGNQFPARTHNTTTGYIPAAGTVGTSGTELVAGYTGITSKSGLFSYTSGSPLSGPSISESGNVMTSVGHTSNYFVLQGAVGTSAGSGLQTQATITLVYDEI